MVVTDFFDGGIRQTDTEDGLAVHLTAVRVGESRGPLGGKMGYTHNQPEPLSLVIGKHTWKRVMSHTGQIHGYSAFLDLFRNVHVRQMCLRLAFFMRSFFFTVQENSTVHKINMK